MSSLGVSKLKIDFLNDRTKCGNYMLNRAFWADFGKANTKKILISTYLTQNQLI